MLEHIDRAKVEEGRIKALEEREKAIAQARITGASVNYISAPLTEDEKETHINISNGIAIIDTTEGKYITKCFKNKYNIIGLTFYKENDDRDRLVGLTCTCGAKQISLRS